MRAAAISAVRGLVTTAIAGCLTAITSVVFRKVSLAADPTRGLPTALRGIVPVCLAPETLSLRCKWLEYFDFAGDAGDREPSGEAGPLLFLGGYCEYH